MSQNLWKSISDEINLRLKSVRAYTALFVGETDGLVTIQRIAEAAPDGEAYARLAGPPIDENAVVAILPMGGKPFVLGAVGGAIEPPASSEMPFVLEESFNSATTSSTTSTSVYSTNVSLSVPLPAGTWTVTVQGIGLYSHSSSGSGVGHRVRIASDAGDVIDGNMPQTSVRSSIPATHSLSGQTGTITVYLEYLVAVSGTAYAGGGTLLVIATREP